MFLPCSSLSDHDIFSSLFLKTHYVKKVMGFLGQRAIPVL